MRFEPFLVNAWADAVFHVLAHVRATAQYAASVYDASYVADVERALGPAAERPLGEDAALLGRLLLTHDALARVQLLAWLFRSPERAAACVGRDLAELGPADVDAPALLAALGGKAPAPSTPRRRAGPPVPTVELLRAAAELEVPLLARLPRPAIDLGALAQELERVAAAAPHLKASRVGVVRSLRLRGRVLASEIWVGEATTAHMAWQAAHEATVAEVVTEHGAMDHERVEREALVRLAGRARTVGLARDHATWLAHLDPETSAWAEAGDQGGDGRPA